MTTIDPPADLAPAITPGIRVGCTRAEYDAIPAVNQSKLKLFRRSPAHVRLAMLEPSRSTEAMELGTLIHTVLLEPQRFREQYVVMPDLTAGCKNADGSPSRNPKQTGDYKRKVADFQNANLGKKTVEADDHAVCTAIGEAIASYTRATELLTSPGRNELGVVWIDEETGLACKALIDRTTSHEERTCIVDIKSALDASPEAFAKDCSKYGYHLQAAFYLDGLNAFGAAPRRFIHVVVEKEPPFGVAVYELDEQSIALGRRRIRAYLRQYAQCQAANDWPAYADAIEPLTLPNWEFSKEYDDAL